MKQTTAHFISLFLPLFLCTSCVNRGLSIHDGKYKGTDGAKNNPQEIQLVIAIAGDGFMNGSWKSPGDIKEGQFSGRNGLFHGEISLNVITGTCDGTFKGTFTFKDREFAGTLGNNGRCPDKTYTFKATKE